MEHKNKSILDGVPVQNTAFPSSDDYQGCGILEQVGNCPTCGGPIYGRKEVRPGEFPVTQRSCTCLPPGKDFQASMHTK